MALWKLAIWWIGIGLQLALLVDAVFRRRMLAFPFFYTQIAVSLVAAIASFYVFRFHQDIYTPWYWAIQYSTMLLACGNIFEILRYTFPPNLGAQRFVRALKYVLLASAAYFCVLVTYGRRVWHIRYVLIERDFRTLQALLLVLLFLGIYYFGLPLRREVKGIFCGYGFYIGASLATLAFEARFWDRFDPFWGFLQPSSYLVYLAVCLAGFWSSSFSVAINLSALNSSHEEYEAIRHLSTHPSERNSG